MKITSVDVFQFPMNGAGGIPRWNPIIVRVNTSEGISGLGEVGLAYGVGAGAAAGMVKALTEAFLINADPLANEPLWEKMYRRSFWAEGGGPVVLGAISAIDVALWDIKGKAMNLPVWRLLGGAAARPLRSYASQLQLGWSTGPRRHLSDPADYREASISAREEGYTCVKVNPILIDANGKIDDNLRGMFTTAQLRSYVARMEAVRDGIGPDGDIIVEMNSLCNLTGAKQLIEAIQHVSLYLVEEPVHFANPSAHHALARAMPAQRFAGGERLYTRWGVEPYLSGNLLDVLQPDLGLAGGLTEGKKIADLAHLHDVTVQNHVCGSPVAAVAALHLQTAIPNFEIHEHHTHALKAANRELCDIDPQPVKGFIQAPDGPGLGIQITPSALSTAIHTRIE